MTKHINNISTLPMIILLAVVVGFSSCKSQKAIFNSKKGSEEVATQEETTQEEIVQEEIEEVEVVETKPAEVREEERIYTKVEQLDIYFGSIASASSTSSANASIQDALKLFNSSEAVVLIVIYSDGGIPSYDEPTTISKYLNYLKDTKNDNAEVEEVVYDNYGEIKELILKK